MLVSLLAGCALPKRAVVDPQGVNQTQYQRDLSEYEPVAGQVSPGRDATEDAVGGAVMGGILGAIFGNSSTAGKMTAGGAVVSATGKAGDAEREKGQVIRNCMRGRGYRVLN